MEKACLLPVSVAGALMPDAQAGYGLPIGGVLDTENAVIPAPPGSELVEITVKPPVGKPPSTLGPQPSTDFPHVDLSRDTERAFAYLRSQCPLNPELEKHLVGYAKMLGMK